jgi:4-hydroxybenzoate polyprenyltransferase
VIGGAFHAFAMHIFSAIPDLEYDREAGILTTALVLGKKKSMIICFTFWSMFSSIVIILSNFHLAGFLSLIYPAIALILLIKDRIQIENVYWYLPFFNTTLGGILWLLIVFNRF